MANPKIGLLCRLALLLWLLCHPALGWSQQESVQESNRNQRQPQANGRHAQDSPLAVKVPDSEVAKQRAAEVAKEHEQETTTDWTSTGLLLVGIFQLALFGGQLWLMYRVERTAKQQLRAYLFIENAFISDPKSPKGVEVTLVVKNFGQTPAYKLFPILHTRIAKIPSQWEIELGERDLPMDAALGPGFSFTTSKTLPAFTAAEMADFVSRARGLFAYGEIRYVDAFGKKRATKFCHQFGGKYGTRAGRIGVCDMGNEAD